MKEFLEQYKLDAVLVHTPANMRNISGFTGEGLVYVSKEDAWILTDSRYTIAAAKESRGFEVLEYKGNMQQYLVEKIVKEKEGDININWDEEIFCVKVMLLVEKLKSAEII